MLKVNFKKIKEEPNVNAVYSDDYIPFSVTIGTYTDFPETIYARNLSGENFIEFRFDKNNQNLYEISLVAVQNDSVQEIKLLDLSVKDGSFYNCLIEKDSKLDFSQPIEIYRSHNSICVSWDIEEEKTTDYYAMTNNCMLGVNSKSYLTAVVLTKLSQDDIFNIFGF